MNITKELLIKNKTGGWREKAWQVRVQRARVGFPGTCISSQLTVTPAPGAHKTQGCTPPTHTCT